MRMILVWILAVLLLGMLAYIRLAPSDPAIWHVQPKGDADKTFRNGVLRRVSADKDGLQRMAAVIAAEPRTTLLKGSPELGMITYISRSRLVGFPDYTTITMSGDDLLIYARSRFGRKDLGVNGARVDRWIATLAAN